MTVNTPAEREALIEGGRRLGVILETLGKLVKVGVTTDFLDTEAERLIRDGGDVPAFLNYTPEGATRAYPATCCVSVNDEVVHGIPNENPKILRNGDIVSLDLGLIHKGMILDSAITVPVGKIDKNVASLMSATENALAAGIASAHVGGRIGDISAGIEESYKGTGFSIVRELGGHGVGREVHEEPWIGNTGTAGTGEEIVDGMVLALEPIANIGKAGITLAPDGYTFRTKDGSYSAHFEHTILIEKAGVTVLTKRPSEK